MLDDRSDVYRSLIACSHGEKCDECSYSHVADCFDVLMDDAATLLRASIEHEDRLNERIKLIGMTDRNL